MTVVLLYAPVDNVQPGVVFQAPGLEFTQWIVLSMIAVAAVHGGCLNPFDTECGDEFQEATDGKNFWKIGWRGDQIPTICRTPIAHPILI